MSQLKVGNILVQQQQHQTNSNNSHLSRVLNLYCLLSSSNSYLAHSLQFIIKFGDLAPSLQFIIKFGD